MMMMKSYNVLLASSLLLLLLLLQGPQAAFAAGEEEGNGDRHIDSAMESDAFGNVVVDETPLPSTRNTQETTGFTFGEEYFEALDKNGEGNNQGTNAQDNHDDLISNHFWPTGELNCSQGYRTLNELTQKRLYKVGVHAPSGEDEAWKQFNLTFVTYLNKVVGQRFQPNIEFEMVVSTNPLNDWVDNSEEVDFMYSDTGIFSCIESEIGAQPLGTTISHLEARGHQYKLDMFAGMIFTRADNDKIKKIADIKDKVIGALAMSDFAGAQVQFWQMLHDKTLDYIMDPKQVVFTGNQEDVVLGVLDGRYDVGLTRTGMFERTIDPKTDEVVNPNDFKVVEPKIYMLDDGQLFPFVHSTPVFPEWPFYSKPRVDRIVSEEVALALIYFEYHYDVGVLIQQCKDQASTSEELDMCNTMPPVYFDPSARCDTTREIAELAYDAGMAARFAGMRPPRSYGIVRSMQEDADLLLQNEDTGEWFCKRASSTYDSFICPEGHYKVREEVYNTQCEDIGLPCPEGLDCYCQPCINAFEIEVSTEINPNCDKMSLCGEIEQTKPLTFHILDNLRRDDAVLSALVHVGQTQMTPPVIKTGPDTYEFTFSHSMRGVAILEVFSNGVQIQESPFRVQVIAKECDSNMEPNEVGECECGSDTIEISGNCLDKGIFAAIMCSIALVVALHLSCVYVNFRKRKSDEMWKINSEELHFDHPVEIIGQGAFGVVLAAEYRGTKVAIKRVLPIANGGKVPGRSGSVPGSREPAIIDSDEEVSEEGEEIEVDLEVGLNSTDGATKAAGGAAVVNRSSSGVNSNESILRNGNTKATRSSRGGGGRESLNGRTSMSRSGSQGVDVLEFLGSIGIGRKKSAWWNPFGRSTNTSDTDNLNILATSSGGSTTTKTMMARCMPWCDENSRRQEEFKEEMRLLSRLRHPCITTVMGAVMNGAEPMMVMEYMENGSLYDLLRNETCVMGGEIIIQILRDISQGLRFLHASKPPILHGDLKAKNILVDSRFRAKVCDFGLSTKKKNGLSGTPYWLAPEYLRRKTDYTPACDIYSVGIILYEIYSRKNPYELENPRRVLRKVCDPRINYRPPVPPTCPKRLSEIMEKCWNADLNFRPEAKDLDLIFTDMNPHDAEPDLDGEQGRIRKEVATGDLLYKVFPRKVADKLKTGQKVEPETHENVTVFFSDIVRFTDISQSMSAVKVSQMLDRLYLAFDELASKHGVFKVETIGDAWMGVTNLENDQNDSHTKRIAEFAVDAVQAASKIPIDEDDLRTGNVHIRVGFHSGQVVSNVIGSLNPRYGLFGDTVNTASRMESLSQSGKIQCSEASAKLLKEQAPEFPLRRRGKIAVKGKGAMATYFVGEALLREEADGSLSRTFNEHPVVAFQEPGASQKSAYSNSGVSLEELKELQELQEERPRRSKIHARPSARVDMVGSTVEAPRTSTKTNSSSNRRSAAVTTDMVGATVETKTLGSEVQSPPMSAKNFSSAASTDDTMDTSFSSPGTSGETDSDDTTEEQGNVENKRYQDERLQKLADVLDHVLDDEDKHKDLKEAVRKLSVDTSQELNKDVVWRLLIEKGIVTN